VAVTAGPALAALDFHGGGNPHPYRDFIHLFAEVAHHTGELVPQDARVGDSGMAAVIGQHVCTADPAGFQLDQHFVVTDLRDGNLFHRQVFWLV